MRSSRGNLKTTLKVTNLRCRAVISVKSIKSKTVPHRPLWLLPVLDRLADRQVEHSWSGMDGMRSAATAAECLIKERE